MAVFREAIFEDERRDAKRLQHRGDAGGFVRHCQPRVQSTRAHDHGRSIRRARRRDIRECGRLHVVDAALYGSLFPAVLLRLRHTFRPERNDLFDVRHDTKQSHAALEERHLVLAHADRRAATAERRKHHVSGQLAHTVHGMRHRLAVIGQRRDVPFARRMRALAIEQRETWLRRSQVGVEREASAREPQFDQRPVLAGGFLKMDESLFFTAVERWLEEYFDGEALKTFQRIGFDQQTITLAVELNRRTLIGLNNPWRANDGHRMAADALQIVDVPLDWPIRAGGRQLRNDDCQPQRAHRDGKTIAQDETSVLR